MNSKQFYSLRYGIVGKYPVGMPAQARRRSVPLEVLQAAHRAWVDVVYEWADMELPSNRELYQFVLMHGTGTPIVQQLVMDICKREKVPMHPATAQAIADKVNADLVEQWQDQIKHPVVDD